MNKIALIIPDAGPLISLARGSALEALLMVDVPIYIVDEVLHETTRNKAFPDAQAIEGFVQNNRQVHVFETEVGRLSAKMREVDPSYSPSGMGEAAIAQFYARLHEIVEQDAPIMVLFEDSDVKRIQIVADGNVWLLTTKAFLKGLEQRNLLASADAVWNQILASGRSPSESEIEREPQGLEPSHW